MAITAPRVLLEGTKYQNRNIGVQRVYEGSASAQALVSGANKIADIAFNYAADEAQEKGREMALAVDPNQIISIDPKTGAPVSMGAASGMGLIGSKAYRRVIESRYAQSIEEEITNQGRILSEQFAGNPDAPTLFAEAMGNYISSMTQHATGMWSGVVEDFGQSYIANGVSVLTAQGLRAQRARLAAGGDAARASAVDAIRAAAASGDLVTVSGGTGGPGAAEPTIGYAGAATPTLGYSGDTSGGPSYTEPSGLSALQMPSISSTSDVGVLNGIALNFSPSESRSFRFQEDSFPALVDAGVRVGIADEIEAQIVDASVMENWGRESRIAAFEGAVEFYISRIDTSNPDSERLLDSMEAAIGSNNVAAFMRLAPELSSFAPFLTSDRDALDSVRATVDGLLTNAADLAKYDSADATAALATQDARMRVTLEQNAQAFAIGLEDTIRASLATGDLSGVTDSWSSSTRILRDLQNEALSAETDDERSSLVERSDSIISGLVEGVARGLSLGLGQEEIRELQALLDSGNTDAMNPSQRAAYRLLQSVRVYEPNVQADVQARLSSIHSSVAAGVDFQREEAADTFATTEILPRVNDLFTMNASGILSASSALVSALEDLPLSDSRRESALTAVRLTSAQASLAVAMEMAAGLGEEQVRLAEQYASGSITRPQGLPESIVSAIDQARDFAAQARQVTFVDTQASRYASDQIDLLQRESARREEARQAMMAINGFGNPSTATGRQAHDNALNIVYQRAQVEALGSMIAPPSVLDGPRPDMSSIEREVPSDLFLNPSYLEDPVLSQVIDRVLSTPNFMPTSLLNAFTTVANGSPTPFAPVILGHWRNARLIEQGGVSSVNPAIVQTMSTESIAALNAFAEAEVFFGTEGVTQAMANYSSYMATQTGQTDEVLVDSVPLSEVLTQVDGWQDFSPELRGAVSAAGYRLAQASRATSGQIGHGQDWILGELNRTIDLLYPDGNGVVMQPTAMGGFTSRTAYPLERELGADGARNFLRYIENDQRMLGANIRFVTTARGADTPVSLELQGAIEEQTGGIVRTGADHAVLVPYGRDRLGGIAYALMRFDQETRELTAVERSDGRGITIYSTNEDGFTTMLSSQFDQDELFRLGAARREVMLSVMGSGSELAGIE